MTVTLKLADAIVCHSRLTGPLLHYMNDTDTKPFDYVPLSRLIQVMDLDVLSAVSLLDFCGPVGRNVGGTFAQRAAVDAVDAIPLPYPEMDSVGDDRVRRAVSEVHKIVGKYGSPNTLAHLNRNIKDGSLNEVFSVFLLSVTESFSSTYRAAAVARRLLEVAIPDRAECEKRLKLLLLELLAAEDTTPSDIPF